MLRSKLRAGVVAGVAAVAVVAPASAAVAQSATVTDSEGDVWQTFYDESTGEETFEAAGSLTNVDVLSTVITHQDRRVVATMTFSDLAKEGVAPFAALVMRFDSGPRRVAMVSAGSGAWKGEHVLFHDSRNSNGPVSCSGFNHTIDYTANTLTMSVPRGCLGTPRWVEAAPITQGFGEGDTYYFDNGGKPGHSYTYPWSTRMRRG